jgi:uncharacterized membrane protein
MTVGMQQAKRPASALLAGPYGHPYHPMLVALPIGVWVASLVFDVASHLSRATALAMGSEWLIAVGIFGALIAGITGFLDLAVIPFGTPASRTANTHMFINLALTFTYAGNFLWRYQTYSAGAPVRPEMIALSAVCVAALFVSGYLGGKLTYRYGVRVAAEVTQAEGYLAPDDGTEMSHRAPRRRA